jgi:hypothetical protein
MPVIPAPQRQDKRIMIQKLARPYLKNKLYMVTHVYNPSYLGGGGRRTVVRSWSGEKWKII